MPSQDNGGRIIVASEAQRQVLAEFPPTYPSPPRSKMLERSLTGAVGSPRPPRLPTVDASTMNHSNSSASGTTGSACNNRMVGFPTAAALAQQRHQRGHQGGRRRRQQQQQRARSSHEDDGGISSGNKWHCTTLFSGERLCTNPKIKRSAITVFRKPTSSRSVPHQRPIFVVGQNGTDPRICVDMSAPQRFSSSECARFQFAMQRSNHVTSSSLTNATPALASRPTSSASCYSSNSSNRPVTALDMARASTRASA